MRIRTYNTIILILYHIRRVNYSVIVTDPISKCIFIILLPPNDLAGVMAAGAAVFPTGAQHLFDVSIRSRTFG